MTFKVLVGHLDQSVGRLAISVRLRNGGDSVMSDGKRLEGVAIVTGAGSGIGRATALLLAARGATVIASDINGIAAEETAAMGDGPISAVMTDVSDVSSVDALVAAAQRVGPLAYVANVAGVLDAMAPVHEIDESQWNRVLGVNLTGPFLVARAAIPAMLDRGGAIVNVASIAGLTGGRAGAAYTASKHGVIGLTQSIAWMYADRGIRCNAVCPGGTATGITTTKPVSKTGMARIALSSRSAVRTAEPEEIAHVISFLLASEAGFVNGAVVTADGGWMTA
jgi:NAD(P)-dependent dehydrogenase (short-subunit alcohol dehydrogenase family)